MATNRRVARVAELIKREVSQMLMGGIKDDRVGVGMVSITNVDVSGDLQHAKIFVSIYGTEEAREETMNGLRSAKGYIRSELGQRVRLRRTPEVLFVEDRSLEQGDRLLGLLGELRQKRQEAGIDEETWLKEQLELEAGGSAVGDRDDLDDDLDDELDEPGDLDDWEDELAVDANLVDAEADRVDTESIDTKPVD